MLDVVTTHHQAYYNGQQDKPSDKDSPIPNHLLAVQGSFLFVLEGEAEHVTFCQTMLTHVLQSQGIGAKTAAGYGYMTVNDRTRQLEYSLLSAEEKILRSLKEQLDSQIKSNNPNASGQLRNELKDIIEKAQSWDDKDILELQTITYACIKFWDPKKKNNKLKDLRQKVSTLIK